MIAATTFTSALKGVVCPTFNYQQHIDICGKREHNADTTIGVAHECFQAGVVPLDFTFTKQNDKNPIIILRGKNNCQVDVVFKTKWKKILF